jgi:hypothetical protein
MTHSGGKPHTNIGDQGQRYEIRATGYPKSDKSVIGWATTLDSADGFATSVCRAPGCTSVEIFDRQDNGVVKTFRVERP